MRRILLVLTVAALMAAMMVAMAVPAFAKGNPGSHNAPYASLHEDSDGNLDFVTVFKAAPASGAEPLGGDVIGGKGGSSHGNPGQDLNFSIPVGGP